MKQPKPNTLWRFVGTGIGQGVLHRVVFSEPSQVVSVQDNSQPAWSFLGSLAEFLEQFRFVAAAPPLRRR